MFEGDLQVKGKTVHYVHEGKGKNIVLLHGIATHSGLWKGVMSNLTKKYSVYAFDLLGFGLSQKPESNELNLKKQGAFFYDVFKELGLQDIIVAGHDLGGGIAQIMSLTYPEIFKAMVLIDTICYDSWPIQILSEGNKVEMLFRHLPPDIIRDTFIQYIKDGLYNKENALQIGQKYWKYIEGKEGMDSFIKLVQSFDNRQTVEISVSLGSLRLPVLIIWGKNDVYLRPSYGYRLSEDIKGAKIEVLDCAGHFLPEDQPGLVSQLMDDFISSIKG
ncbi:soluble epoxide hydrolase [Oxobacter pfennigii]|uniref:Soluble epoxide hydrolase n=1 Tax=Oxobacter pfennigii TaxID=36849 RepID=A0A0P8WC66_9CLOT|nr:alpha/beta hydrolase [Oxobacter pfennigii]KPU46338.1 soluble epoxide hydrolase [Oxobacter pfennigii]